METPQESGHRKFPTNSDMRNHYIGVLEWLISKGKPHNVAIKIAYHNTINTIKTK